MVALRGPSASVQGSGVPPGERGSAVVDFVMVSMLIVALLLAVLQVAVYVHVRNVVTASAQAGARYAANADVDSAAAAPRTVEVVARATSVQTAEGLACTSGEEVDPSGLTLVVVRCTGAVPSLLSALGNLLPLEVTGRAVKEAA
ncbi:TadE/TadG family type IV pilus assembly protein [Blastococcus tunisiensis]|uniref:TadE-like protein n=1 Tax=Blastococcus tunisiensis TaxID=1798228 RepID=A0A1I2JE05_9ACTN|nr:TadE/TadG family type IV pilus assembly protein [Blastococcus sp. DSM 46838]SFF53082.1 TadE-like protein [Blastococcus sp. DSM 46838]